eukprot:c17039_g1_i1 orf=104-820(-)
MRTRSQVKMNEDVPIGNGFERREKKRKRGPLSSSGEDRKSESKVRTTTTPNSSDVQATERDELKGARVMVNRAPVLTLWVATVAQREGYTFEEGVSFGRAIAGMLAHAKGRKLGLYEERDHEKRKRKRKTGEVERFEVFGMTIAGSATPEGARLAHHHKGQPISPSSVEAYLHKAFASNYQSVKDAMEKLANAYPPNEIGKVAYSLYMQFRPKVMGGIQGWGAKGALFLGLIERLSKG